ncbi:hypothetical protein V5O48_008863 [Marasmius crinis-equi]|uniref:FAD-binding FR-type domain-containing protein n=1 Tax=Marasmius crinis-equi TaxID=585013 RepID=A0ABR3FDB2_9AGAR
MNGWHPGELAIHKKLNFDQDPNIQRLYTAIKGDLDPHHAVFHTTCLTLLPVTTFGEDGRPWVSILAAEDGLAAKAGGGKFIENPGFTLLTIASRLWVGDPILDTMKGYRWNSEDGVSLEDDIDKGMLIAGLGIEFTTRRRNKFAGKVRKLKQSEDNRVDIEVFVNESIGNCPKYINVRSLDAHPNTNPRILYQNKDMSDTDRLPEEVISMIKSVDTVFMGTTYRAKACDKSMFPSHTGINHRGGLPGWVRVKPSDGRTVYVPDFSGNRLMTSLGNIEATPLAGLTFLNWENGDVLYITGHARNLIGAEVQKVMPMHQRAITEIVVSGFTYVQDALTVRQTPGTKPERSPYNPPIQYLAEEGNGIPRSELDEETKASLVSIEIHSKNVATFTWETTQEVDIQPGQAIILDLNSFLADARYQHMLPPKPSSVNDPRIRTWTVSSAHTGPTRRFQITMKWKDGGTATTTLFTMAHELKDSRPELLRDTKELQLNVRVTGTTGAFSLPSAEEGEVKKVLWIAGGVGFTPFISMLKGLSQLSELKATYDIVFLLSTREPEVLIPIISAIQTKAKETVRLTLIVFSREKVDMDPSVYDTFEHHSCRLTSQFFAESPLMTDVMEREGYLCGPVAFEQTVIDGLDSVGVMTTGIHREIFLY